MTLQRIQEPQAVTEEGTIQAQIDATLSQVHGPLVAKVLAYNPTTQRATVQPVAQWTGTCPQPLTLQAMANVPVLFPGGNGFTIVSGLGPGDTVVVVFLGRSHDEWLTTGAVNADPVDWRQHSLSDAVIIGGLTPDVAPLTSLQARPGELVIGLATGVQLRVNKIGQVRLGSATTDVVKTVSDTLQALLTATVNTSIGPQPLDAATLATLASLKTSLDSLVLP